MSKVYERPDLAISKVWQREDGLVVRESSLWPGKFIDLFGREMLQALEGRWMPWTPPTFPVRVKCYRRCWATLGGARYVFSLCPYEGFRQFRLQTDSAC